jgi:hypothetical protein
MDIEIKQKEKENSKRLNDLKQDFQIRKRAWILVFGDIFDDEEELKRRRELEGSNNLAWKKKSKYEEDMENRTIHITGFADLKWKDSTGKRIRIDKYIIQFKNDAPSLFYKFNIKAINYDKSSFGMPLLNCKSYSLDILKLDKEILKSLFVKCEIDLKTIETYFNELGLNNKNCEQTQEENVKGYTQERIYHIKKWLLQKFSKIPAVIDQEDIKRYFLSNELKTIEAFYPEDKERIIHMRFFTIYSIYWKLRNRPAIMCCKKLYNFKWQVEDPDSDEIETLPTYATVVKMRELELSKLESELKKVVDERKRNFENYERAWVSIYKYIKKSFYDENHYYVEEWSIKEYHEDKFGKEDYEKALDFLRDNEIIFHDKENGRMYLYDARVHEEMLSLSISEVYKRNLLGIPNEFREEGLGYLDGVWDEFQFNESIKNEENRVTNGLSEEQIESLRLFITKPMLCISGPGGSGKTHVLEKFIKMSLDNEKPFKICITALQHKNVGHLMTKLEGLPIKCFTTCQLIMLHTRCCNRSKCSKINWSELKKTTTFKNLKKKVQEINEIMTGESLVDDEYMKECEERFESENSTSTQDSVSENDDSNIELPSLQEGGGGGGRGKEKKEKKVDKTSGIIYEDCPFESMEYLFIDEAGLENVEIMAKLIFSLASCAKNFIKIIAVGDKYQLSSIKPGNFLEDFSQICEKEFSSFIEFKENHRVASQLLFDNSNFIKKDQPEKIVFDNKVAIRIDFPENYKVNMPTLFRETIEDYDIKGETTHFITFTNEMKNDLNVMLEKIFLKMEGDENYRFSTIYPGSKIIIKKNEASEEIVNNEILIVTKIYDYNETTRSNVDVPNSAYIFSTETKRYIVCKTTHGVEKTFFLDSKLKKVIKKAWVTTNHSFIGDESDDFVYTIPWWNKRETRKTAYTGFTRAKKRLFFIGSLETLEKAVHAEEPLRRTSLVDITHNQVIKAIEQMKKNKRTRAKRWERNRKVELTGSEESIPILQKRPREEQEEEEVEVEKPKAKKIKIIPIKKKEQESMVVDS